MTGTDLSGCRSRGAQVILCPQHLNAFRRSQCGFSTAGAEPINCTMEVMAPGHVPPQIAYVGGGTYCVATTARRYRHGPSEWCDIPDSSFCFKPRAEVQVAQERIIPIPEPSTIHLTVQYNVSDLQNYVARFGYSIPLLPEKLTALLKAVDLSQKHYFTLEQKTKDVALGIADIQSPAWWEWGTRVDIPVGLRMASHTLVIVQLVIVVYLIINTCKARRALKAHRYLKLFNKQQQKDSPV